MIVVVDCPPPTPTPPLPIIPPLFHNNLQAYSELVLPTSLSSPLFSAAILSTARTLFCCFFSPVSRKAPTVLEVLGSVKRELLGYEKVWNSEEL
jgi:hypothetical protein